jgi:hypothetical protein
MIWGYFVKLGFFKGFSSLGGRIRSVDSLWG